MLLPPMPIQDRLERLRASLDGADGLLVTSGTNIRYLTGFTGSAGMLLVLPDETILVTDGRYETQSAEQLAASGSRPGPRSPLPPASVNACRISWPAGESALSRWRRPTSAGPGSGTSLSGGSRASSSWPRSASSRSCDGSRMPARRPGSRQLRTSPIGPWPRSDPSWPTGRASGSSASLDTEMRRLGAAASFGPSVRPDQTAPPSPVDAAHPAGGAGGLDFGAIVDGYCSDMTRTVWVGGHRRPRPAPGAVVVAASQAAGVAAVAAG